MERRQDAIQYLRQGFEAQRDGDLDRAIALYQQSLQACATAEAHTYLGWAYSQQGKLDAAIDECESAIALDPEFGNPYNDIGTYLIERGDYEAAVPYLEKAMKARRNESPHYPHFNLGRVFVQRGMLLKAAEEFREALKIEPNFQLAAEGLIQVTENIN